MKQRLFPVATFILATSLCARAQKAYWTVSGPPAASASLVGSPGIEIPYYNFFRFDPNVKTSTSPIAAATPPSQLAFTPSSQPTVGASNSAPTTEESGKDGNKPLTEAKIPAAQPNCPSDPGAAIRSEDAFACWRLYRGHIETHRVAVNRTRDLVNEIIRMVADEQSCYGNKLALFSHAILTEREATVLVAFASGNNTVYASDVILPPTSCHREGAEAWPFQAAQNEMAQLNSDKDDLGRLRSSQGFLTWLKNPDNKAVDTTLSAQLDALISEATGYATGNVGNGAGAVVTQTYSDLLKVDQSNRRWRDRLSMITGSASLLYRIPIDGCREWYGKGRKDTITLTSIDLSSATGASSDLQLATNTCNPLSIASTGIGISFLANPTYSFVPTDNANNQVVGMSSKNDRLPLYALMYNVSISGSRWDKPVEFFATAGVGLTSTSSTTTGDFLGGLSVSLARRTLFLTPALDFGQRTTLAPGFTLNTTPQGSLTAVPTVTTWKPGFMLAISFGVGPS